MKLNYMTNDVQNKYYSFRSNGLGLFLDSSYNYFLLFGNNEDTTTKMYATI